MEPISDPQNTSPEGSKIDPPGGYRNMSWTTHVGTPEPPCHGRHAGSPSSTEPFTNDIELPKVRATPVPTTEVSSGILAGVGSGSIDLSRNAPLQKIILWGGWQPVLPPPDGATELGRLPHPPPSLKKMSGVMRLALCYVYTERSA